MMFGLVSRSCRGLRAVDVSRVSLTITLPGGTRPSSHRIALHRSSSCCCDVHVVIQVVQDAVHDALQDAVEKRVRILLITPQDASSDSAVAAAATASKQVRV